MTLALRRNYRSLRQERMGCGASLAKRTLAVDPVALRRLVKVGRSSSESEAVRAAVKTMFAIGAHDPSDWPHSNAWNVREASGG